MLVPGAASAALVALSWLAQAEPAPAEEPILPAPISPAPTPPAELTPRQPLHAIAVHGRFAYRPNDSGSGVPTEGFSLGGTFERRYAVVGNALGLGVGLDLFFDRFSTDGTHISLMPRALTQTSFVALQTVALERLPVRPWLAAGGGVAIGSSTRPVARGAVGVELGLTRATAIAVRADLTHPLSDAGAYGDILDVGLGFLQRF
jgi:hypothetical protein